MGASGWSYTTPYVDDPATSLRLTNGTHSILDVGTFLTEDVAPDARFGDYGVLRRWSKAKVAEVVGTAEPTSADLDAFDTMKLFDADPSLTKCNGRCIVLYKDGRPHELLIWGWSGD